MNREKNARNVSAENRESISKWNNALIPSIHVIKTHSKSKNNKTGTNEYEWGRGYSRFCRLLLSILERISYILIVLCYTVV